MADLVAFLATVSAFAALDADERTAVADRCLARSLPAGSRLLAQGASNDTLFVLRSGQLVVRTRQGERVETLAHLSPPAIVGEVSFLTGRTCSADVDVLVDAELVALPRASLAGVPGAGERLARGLAGVVADRLHATLTSAHAPAGVPVVLTLPGPTWAAPRAFPLELSRALAREARGDVLLVTAAGDRIVEAQPLEPGLAVASLPALDRGARQEAVTRLPAWTTRFAAVVVACDAPVDAAALTAMAPLATHACALLGPDDAAPPVAPALALVAQDARRPTLDRLDGTHQLVPEIAEAEAAYAAGRPSGDGFRAAAASFARAVLGQQVGVALGAGGGRGWCHVGVLAALAHAGLPIDVIAGTSMGAVVGGLWADGRRVEGLEAVAADWRGRRLREWRLWRLHMASERRLDALMFDCFGDRTVNTTRTPFWANATDIERGEEVVLRRGPLRQVVRASMAFPGWTPPVAFEGRLLVDGAVVNPAPAGIVRQMGAAFVITVLAFGPTPPLPLARRFPARTYDLFARTLHLSSVAMGHASSDTDSDAVVVPDLGDATMLSFERDRELIAAGRRAGEAQAPAILEAYDRLRQARRPGLS